MNRAAWLITILLVGAFCWIFPPFRVVPLKQARQHHQQGQFDAQSFATQFWESQLLPAAAKALQATQLLAALTKEPDTARRQLGRSPGLSSTVYFFVQGTGQITTIQRDRVRIYLPGSSPPAEVELFTGFLFGNCVRDATGQLDASDFPNSQHFNSLSTELNRVVESTVIPSLRQGAALGRSVRFVGCAELQSGPPPKHLTIVPVKIEWL